MGKTDHDWIDTLKLSDEEHHQILERMGDDTKESRFADLRADDRVAFELPSGAVMKLYHPGGTITTHLIHPRNLSRKGMSFLHGNYVHTNSRCEVYLRTFKNQTAVVEGSIMWCRHVHGRVHEVGVQFAHPIVMSAFVKNSPEPHATPLRQALAPLHNRLLYVEDCADDRDLLAFYFKNVGVEISKAAEALAALEMCESQPNLEVIITSSVLPGVSGLELVEMLRAAGFKRTIMVLITDATPATEQAALALGATIVMNKPYQFADLAARLREHLPSGAADAAEQGLISDHWSNIPMRPLILSFLDHLEKQVAQLAAFIHDTENRKLLEKMCVEMRGTAGGYGFPTIAAEVQKLYDDAHGNMPVATLESHALELTRLCQAAGLIHQRQQV